MTGRLYKTSSEIERARALCEKGVLLAERTESFHKFKLYQVLDIYLEVTWHIHFNVVIEVSSFNDMEHLEPYLDTISIEGLFS